MDRNAQALQDGGFVQGVSAVGHNDLVSRVRAGLKYSLLRRGDQNVYNGSADDLYLFHGVSPVRPERLVSASSSVA